MDSEPTKEFGEKAKSVSKLFLNIGFVIWRGNIGFYMSKRLFIKIN